jgi:serine/threonine protein kinase
MAPEILLGDMYNFKSDVWSYGTVIYELFVGETPFAAANNKEDLKYRVKN